MDAELVTITYIPGFSLEETDLLLQFAADFFSEKDGISSFDDSQQVDLVWYCE